MESYEVFLADEEKRKRFYDDLSPYARALQLALSSDKIDAVFNEKEIAEYKAKMKFYAKLRQAVRIRYHERVDFGKYEKQMQKLLDTFISAEEVDRLTKPVNIFEAEFDDEVARVEGSSAKADAILHAVAAAVSEKRESNPAYYDKFSKRIKEIIEAYKAKRLSEEEKLKEARKVQEEFLRGETETESDHYPEALRGKSRARAFYDNLETPLTQAAEGQGGIAVQDLPLAYGEKKENDLLTQTALRIDEVFREASKKPDWQTNRDVRNRIEERIDDILWELEQNYGMKFDDIETLLKELVQIGVRHDG
jgi:type I restriction enzyme R subunit